MSTSPGTGQAASSLLRQAITVPNALSVVRLGLVPVFLWLLLGPRHDELAIVVLAFAGFSDWLDGKLARWLNQTSRLGELLDPAADRLYILATLLAFLYREILPWWVIAVLVGREIVVAVSVLVIRSRGYQFPGVSYIGKGATFVLMYAFPLLLLIQGDSVVAEIARPVAYALMMWGGVLYVWSGVLYVLQTILAVRQARRGATGGGGRLAQPRRPNTTRRERGTRRVRS
ncbi:CDP-alcohol phosphatidyltransferase family protein [Haloechinothrix sp. LS1_15]|uniref:CDP-alcohol phosphatidyltransferase family protein n=1 Tax=Haloechinothrix sp. LS1_15 TaxID=2652248 RepID=UPI0029473B70|nr:CDP-alcohol phosphatidyltransferase family protein [Haloechinothrix sp. LS1_15]MDV6014619.1 CDP-alcohol phosphatidyltransferase family protein [Haloechinothrix sp. LS1_15]